MKKIIGLLSALMLWSAGSSIGFAADPVVSNVVARQLPDTRQVEIAYDIADADGDTLFVRMEVSDDGGATFSVQALTISGDLGVVMPGRGKRVVWNAGPDLGEVFGEQYQVKLVALDEPFPGMVLVPAGEFIMGSTQRFEENPEHTVYLDAFWIDQFEVTNSAFKSFVESTGHITSGELKGKSWVFIGGNMGWENMSGAQWDTPRGPESDLTGKMDRPVVHVSWLDAHAYCGWAGKRLPTEAEWEKAARGTDARTYPWGEEIDSNKANFSFNIGGTTDVGSYPEGVSPYGAYDMAGNVWEWVSDWYDDTYYSRSPDRNPKGPVDGSLKLVRGGSYNNFSIDVRASYRFRYCHPTDTYDNNGIRCAQDQRRSADVHHDDDGREDDPRLPDDDLPGEDAHDHNDDHGDQSLEVGSSSSKSDEGD